LHLLLRKSKKLPVFFYDIFLFLYRQGIGIYSLWNPKAKNWLVGRKNIFKEIQSQLSRSPDRKNSNTIWIHCSSLGEFEQGRPIIEEIRAKGSGNEIILTFFSPSGYESKKDYPGVNYVFYLPMDSKKNAGRFLDLVNPSLVIFIKYDLWYHYLHEIKKRETECLLVSAIFRKDQVFFKWYGSLQKKMLGFFTNLFVQDEASKKLLESIHIHHCIVSGDTRFDAVLKIAEKFEPIVTIECFIDGRKCIVAGSTWKTDEDFLKNVFDELQDHELALIIAPHEIYETHLDELAKLFPNSIKFSECSIEQTGVNHDVLIIDNVGTLSRLYKYGYITYVGGGFTRDGVHNVLEAAVYGKPVVFGKNYKKYREAVELLECGGAKSFSNRDELHQVFSTLLHDEDDYRQKCLASKIYVSRNGGATKKVLDYIEEKRLLTS